MGPDFHRTPPPLQKTHKLITSTATASLPKPVAHGPNGPVKLGHKSKLPDLMATFVRPHNWELAQNHGNPPVM